MCKDSRQFWRYLLWMETKMKHVTNFLVLAVTLVLTFGCGSGTLRVVSEPEQAEVFIVTGSETPALIGTTPLVKSGKDLQEVLKGQDKPGGLVNVRVKKEGFKTSDFWVPVNAGGTLATNLVLKLEASNGEVEMTTAKEVVRRLFLAQQFARDNQLERALIEIDKVLEMYPEFDRALTMKAAIYYAKGDFQESLKWYESALAINPELKNAVVMAGKVRETLKMPVKNPLRLPATPTEDSKTSTNPSGNKGK